LTSMSYTATCLTQENKRGSCEILVKAFSWKKLEVNSEEFDFWGARSGRVTIVFWAKVW